MGSFDANKAEKNRLLAGMDKTMAQKLAFASAHFQLSDGARILDVGCGTGYGSYQFSLLNPHLQVVGLDYDRDYIERARKMYPLPNLSFVQGDARRFDSGGEKFDAIFNSSILHEVFSFSGYSKQAVVDSLTAQMDAVRDGGVILIRDFVRPAQPDAMIYMDLIDEEARGSKIEELSAQDMLRLYADWAYAEKPESQRGFFLEAREGEAPAGWHRFYLQHDWANEFILRKDYRDRFYIEAKEKYGYLTPQEFRSVPSDLGARVLYTSPYANPWIVENRMKGKVRLFNENRDRICLPPTNFICVMQKVPDGHGVIVREHKVTGHELTYLKTQSYKNNETGQVVDLVSRPGDVFDILPYYVHDDGKVDIYARSDYPRPLVGTVPRQMSPRLDGKTWSGYMVEPFAVANQNTDIVKAAKSALKRRAGISGFKSIERGPDYYPMMDSSQERVGSLFVELKKDMGARPLSAGFSGFHENGNLRPFSLIDMMRGIQVGMFPEARLELSAYRLARKLDMEPPVWMGQTCRVVTKDQYQGPEECLVRKFARAFTATEDSADYLQGVRSVFAEEGAERHGAKTLAQCELEFVVPKHKPGKNASNNLAVIIPVARSSTGTLMVGLKESSFAALEVSGENTQIESLMVKRLPSALKSMDDVRQHLAGNYQLSENDVIPLGEGYFPSMGIMPDRAYPLLLNVSQFEQFRDFRFVPVRDLWQKVDDLRDANLMLAVYRLTHAFDQWPKQQVAVNATPPSP